MFKIFVFSLLLVVAFTLMLKFLAMTVDLLIVLKSNRYQIDSEKLNVFIVLMNVQLLIKFIEVSIVMCLVFILDNFVGGPMVKLLYHTYKLAVLDITLVQLTPSLTVILCLFISYFTTFALYLYSLSCMYHKVN